MYVYDRDSQYDFLFSHSCCSFFFSSIHTVQYLHSTRYRAYTTVYVCMYALFFSSFCVWLFIAISIPTSSFFLFYFCYHWSSFCFQIFLFTALFHFTHFVVYGISFFDWFKFKIPTELFYDVVVVVCRCIYVMFCYMIRCIVRFTILFLFLNGPLDGILTAIIHV